MPNNPLDSFQERTIELLQEAANLAAITSSPTTSHLRRFTKLRESLSRLLLVAVGSNHRLYHDFLECVTEMRREDLEFAVDISRELLGVLTGADSRRSLPRFEDLLHPSIASQGLRLFQQGHFRDAVFNSIVAVFDLIRERTGLHSDGAALATEALAVASPHLIVADLSTETGKSEQVGLMMLLQGAYSAVRNPKAHTLRHDTSRETAAQYLVFASLLARRISEATTRSA